MSSDAYCPDAGDIIWLQFSPQLGREQAERRPALVLSPRQYNAFSRLCVVCPITNTVRGWKLEVVLAGKGTKTTGAVLADQVKSLSWTDRGSEFIEAAPQAVLADTRAKVKAVIGL
jgi:mRNA interferase MazF